MNRERDGNMGIHRYLMAACIALAATGCTGIRTVLRGAGTRGVRVSSPAVVLRQNCSPHELEAADELAGYLGRILGHPVSRLAYPVSTPQIGHIHIGISPPGERGVDQKGPAYVICTNGTFLYGRSESSDVEEISPGLLSAVHAFLERECGVHWVIPGKKGSVIPNADALVLRAGKVYEVRNLLRVDAYRFPSVPDKDVQTWLTRNRAKNSMVHTIDTEICGYAATPFPVGGPRTWSQEADRTPKSVRVTVGPGLIGAFDAYLAIRMARDPDSAWEQVLGDFCAVFGNGANSVEKYHTFWRNHTKTQVLPVMEKIGAGNEFRQLYLRASELYPRKTFTKAVTFLHEAMLEVDSAVARKLLQQLVVDHEHAAIVAQTCALTTPPTCNQRPEHDILQQIKLLRDTRNTGLRGHLTDAKHSSLMEGLAGDITGLDFLEITQGKRLVRRLPVIWYADAGKASWENVTARDLRKQAKETVRTDMAWEDSGDSTTCSPQWIAVIHDVDPDMRKRKLYLGFWGITADVDVFVNGMQAGRHRPRDIGKTSSLVRFDMQLDATTDEQVFSLKVTGNSPRDPGIWRPLWLVAEDTEK